MNLKNTLRMELYDLNTCVLVMTFQIERNYRTIQFIEHVSREQKKISDDAFIG